MHVASYSTRGSDVYDEWTLLITFQMIGILLASKMQKREYYMIQMSGTH